MPSCSSAGFNGVFARSMYTKDSTKKCTVEFTSVPGALADYEGHLGEFSCIEGERSLTTRWIVALTRPQVAFSKVHPGRTKTCPAGTVTSFHSPLAC